MSDVVTVDQIRDLIKSENIRPSDLFPMEKLVADPMVKGYAEDRIRERIGSEYQHRKETEEKLAKIEKEQGPKEAALLEEIKTLRIESAKAKTGALFEKQKEARKLDERQVKFLQIKLPKFSPVKVEDVEKEFNSFLDEGIDEYGKISKELGLEKSAGDDGGQQRATGAEAAKNASTGGKDKYLDPAKNPFIKIA